MRGGDGVRCWGRDFRERPGAPAPDGFDLDFTDVAELGAGENFLCARSLDSKLSCAGLDPSSDSGESFDTSAEITDSASALAVGLRHICYTTPGSAGVTAGQVYCWGDNALGQIDPGRTPAYPMPELVTVIPVLQTGVIAAGANHTCLLAHRTAVATSFLHCWG
ncbi:MAG: hypothetical protein AB8I08_06975, partial [Sandaracinaceae bacterium]